jgi:acyl-CoA synthetase (AMP-forming)/AMP-acid ligase II
MMDEPLLISSLIDHAARFHSSVEIVYPTTHGGFGRYDYAQARHRAKKLAQALLRYGVLPGDRVATMAWNSREHFELYYGVSGIGGVLHTINPRLFAEQIIYIANHAADRILFIDPSFIRLVETISDRLDTIETYVIFAPRDAIPASTLPLVSYEAFLEGEKGDFAWPLLDERSASSLCYTSGTTGNPRGALYSHRSTVLHTLNACSVDGHGVSGGDCILPAVPMFHGNAWGVPYSAAASGAKLVLPGSQLDGASLCQVFEQEQVTLSLGVPTVWSSVLDYADSVGLTLQTLRRVIVGGSAVPQSMVERFRERHATRVVQAWGMTEMSPLGAAAAPKHKHAMAGQAALDAVNQTQGRPPYLVDAKICGPHGEEQPHDGVTSGDLFVRGPWVISAYFNNPEASAEAFRDDGWLKTGDVCTIDCDGFIKIIDRSKDVIKSGGEWISSIELENIASAHPDVAEAAVIGVKHPKWEERPLLVVVGRPGREVDPPALLRFFEGRVAKWWIPDQVVVTEALPHTATGKISKVLLRTQMRDMGVETA